MTFDFHSQTRLRAYLVICSSSLAVLGYDQMWLALRFDPVWDTIIPRIGFILIYVVAIALDLAVFIMLSWQLYLISSGYVMLERLTSRHPIVIDELLRRTTVENYDHDRYQKLAKQRGTVRCINK